MNDINPIILSTEKPEDKIKEITEKLEKGILDLFNSDRYKNYLTAMSKFHNYSVNNTILIAMQKPDASLVAGFNKWKNDFKRCVKKGEKGIKIIAPAPFKVRHEIQKTDNHGNYIIGNNGKPVVEVEEITIPKFKVVTVFDVSQTDGKELPNISVSSLDGSIIYSKFIKIKKMIYHATKSVLYLTN